jgi:hypothetical protein
VIFFLDEKIEKHKIIDILRKSLFFNQFASMETTFFLAKLFGILFFVVGLGILFNLKYYTKVMDHFLKDGPLLYFAGLIITIVGYIMVLHHNIWIGGWETVITVLAWATMVKGVLFLLFPRIMVSWKKSLCTNTLIGASGIIGLLFGLYLLYMSGMCSCFL